MSACNVSDFKQNLNGPTSFSKISNIRFTENPFIGCLFVTYVWGGVKNGEANRHTLLTFKCERAKDERTWRDAYFQLCYLPPGIGVVRSLVNITQFSLWIWYNGNHISKAFVVEIWRQLEGTVLWHKNFRHSNNFVAAQPPTNCHELQPDQAGYYKTGNKTNVCIDRQHNGCKALFTH
jgi:hypothetical protein